MNRNLNKLFVGIAAVAAVAAVAPTGAHAQTNTIPVQYPWAVKLGVAFATDSSFSSTSFDGGLSYDLSKTTADNPVIYQVYGDYYGQSKDNLFGIGVGAKFLLGKATEINKPYVGVGIGDYIARVEGSSTKNNFGGKVFAGYDFTQQVFGEVDYSITQKINGVTPDAIGVRVGYRF